MERVRRAWQPTLVFLPGESHKQQPDRRQSIGSQELDMANMHAMERVLDCHQKFLIFSRSRNCSLFLVDEWSAYTWVCFLSLNVASLAPAPLHFFAASLTWRLNEASRVWGRIGGATEGSGLKPDYGWLKLRLGQIIQVLKESIVKVKLQKIMLANTCF